MSSSTWARRPGSRVTIAQAAEDGPAVQIAVDELELLQQNGRQAGAVADKPVVASGDRLLHRAWFQGSPASEGFAFASLLNR